jgi:predicted dehydrogenase
LLRVGIVGFGEIGRVHATHLAAAGARVVGVVTRRETEFDRYPSLAALLPEVDTVTIAVPNHLHASLCVEVLRAGKPVFVEKPLGMVHQELDAIEEALAGASVPLHVGFRLRWNPRLRALRERLSGVRRIRCTYRLGLDKLADGKPWTRESALSGGAFFTLGVHAFDLVRWLAGARGEPLSDLQATASHRDGSADFPLVGSLSGVLPSGVEIVAGVDLREGATFHLDLHVDAESGAYPDPSLPGLDPEEEGSERVEYAGLMAAFAHAAESGELDRREHAELLQAHRDLVRARSLAEGC